jgi:hypothetical protein
MFVEIDYGYEAQAARDALKRIYYYSKDQRKARIAFNVLRDKKLFKEYVELRIAKKRAEARKKLLTNILNRAKNIFPQGTGHQVG